MYSYFVDVNVCLCVWMYIYYIYVCIYIYIYTHTHTEFTLYNYFVGKLFGVVAQLFFKKFIGLQLLYIIIIAYIAEKSNHIYNLNYH